MQASARLRVWGLVARRHPSAFLLAAQLLSLLVYPLIDGGSSGRLLFGAVVLVVVPLALWVVMRSPLMNWIGWLLAIPAMVLTLFGVIFEHAALLPVSLAMPAGAWLARRISARALDRLILAVFVIEIGKAYAFSGSRPEQLA